MIKLCMGLNYFSEEYRQCYFSMSKCYDSVEQINIDKLHDKLSGIDTGFGDSDVSMWIVFYEQTENQFVETFSIEDRLDDLDIDIFREFREFLDQIKDKEPKTTIPREII